MARLPVPGSDKNAWGIILNEYLAVEHNIDGSLKRAADITQAKADSAQAKADVAQAKADIDAAVANVNGKLDSSSLNAPNGIATLDANGKLVQQVDAAKVTSGVLDAARIPDLSAVYLPVGQALTMEAYDGSTQQYKLLAMNDGSIRAVPANATPPAIPANVAADIHLVYLTLTWDAVPDATQYRVYRDGSLLATANSASYLDEAITVGVTYEYTVIAVNQHGMWSQPSTAVTAFINPALNTAPVIASISVWPTDPRPNEKVYVHVNASDVDVQQLATTLGVTVGSLQATFDPTTWIWQGV